MFVFKVTVFIKFRVIGLNWVDLGHWYTLIEKEKESYRRVTRVSRVRFAKLGTTLSRIKDRYRYILRVVRVTSILSVYS